MDSYELGTRRERGYMCGIASVYQDDCIEDVAIIAATAVRRDTIRGVEVYI